MEIGSFVWYFKFTCFAKIALNFIPQYDKAEGERRKKGRGRERRVTNYSLPLELEQALEDKSVTARNNVITILFTGAEMGSLYCLRYLKFNW